MKLVNAINIPNMPWEECPKGFDGPIWRYSQNPVVKRNPLQGVCRIFNSALLPYKGEFIGVFRGETTNGIPYLYLGTTKDGLHFSFEKEPLKILNEDGTVAKINYAYDPRLIEIEGVYYVICCEDFHGPALMIAMTTDFKKFVRYNHPFLPYNRNGVLFPRKIDGYYHLLSRPSDTGHTKFGDIFVSKSPDMKFWGDHKHVMEPGWEWWCGTKIGAGANPIETDEGWLIFFHGVSYTCNGFVYSMGGAILDLNDPSKVLYRCSDFLLTPEEEYETVGFVPNVIFPTSTLVDAKTGRIAIYYGSADTYTSLAFTTVEKVTDFIKKHSR